MKSIRSYLVLAGGIICLILTFVFRGPIILGIERTHMMAEGILDISLSYEAFVDLKTQNARLRYELEALKKKEGEETKVGNGYVLEAASVFSEYPLNDKKTVIIDRGEMHGMKEGMTVLVSEGVLLGRIKKVKRTQSEVETIFDPAWKSSVAVGEGRAKGVLEGGTIPKVSLIPRASKIGVGDMILSISPEFPLDLTIGHVSLVQGEEKSTWYEALVDVGYNNENRERVLVVRDFP